MAIPLRRTLTRLGQASPLAPTGVYVAAMVLGNALVAFFPNNALVAVLFLLLWALALLLLLVVVVWFRDDDALAAGFLMGVAWSVAGFLGTFAAALIHSRSVGAALFTAWAAILGRLLWTVVAVLIAAGIVWLLRQATVLLGGRPVERSRGSSAEALPAEWVVPKRRVPRIPNL